MALGFIILIFRLIFAVLRGSHVGGQCKMPGEEKEQGQDEVSSEGRALKVRGEL
jgi:hypothetical protein